MSVSKKYSKKRPIKEFSIGLLLLCSVSLLSVGFSTWYSGADAKGEGTVQIEIADTVELNDVFEVQTPKMFAYNEYGIIRDEQFLSDGYIYFPILINTNASHYSLISIVDDNLYLNLSVMNKGRFNILDEAYLKTTSDIESPIAYSVSGNGFSDSCSLEVTWTRTNNTINFPIQINGMTNYLETGKVYLNIAFHFSFDDYTNAYPNILQYGLSFSVSVGVNTP